MPKSWKYGEKANSLKNPCNTCNMYKCEYYDILTHRRCMLDRNYRSCDKYHVKPKK